MAIRAATPSWQLGKIGPALAVGGTVALAVALLIVRAGGLTPATAGPYAAPPVELPTAAPISPTHLPLNAEPAIAPIRADPSRNPAPAVEPASSSAPSTAPSTAPGSPNRTSNVAPSRFADDPSVDGSGLRGQTTPGLKFQPAR